MKANFRSLKSFKLALAAASGVMIGSVAATAAPLISVGERGAIFFNGSVTLRADDNIYLNANNEESDIIFIFSPGVEFTYGGAGIWNFSAYYREDIYRYTDATELNVNNSNVFANANYAEGRVIANIDGSFQQVTQNTFDIQGDEGDVVEREIFRIGVDGEYDLTELFDVGTGVSYQRTDFKTQQFRDIEVVTVPVDIYYDFTETMDLSLGYRFRDNNTKGTGRDSRDHFVNVGARGEITPLITGSVKVGYQQRNFRESGLSSRSGVAAEGEAIWNASDRTNVSITASRDFRYSANGETIERLGVGPRVSYLFTELVTGTAGVHYEDSQYRDRDRHDKTWHADLGLSYAPNEYVDLSAAYIYTNNDSNISAVDLDRNIFQLTASLRY